MHEAVTGLLDQRVVGPDAWRSLWDELDAGRLDRAECVALLASLTTALPGHETLAALLASLDERRPAAGDRWPGSVNIVGTGGGPSTFNISTAAAFVAAAMGVRVVKTGSRAYSSRFGSIDLLDRLGVTLTRSHEHTAHTLDRFGIAFTGPYVYPRQLTQLARTIVPVGMRSFGRFLNALGPLLTGLPVTAQVTGVSSPERLITLRQLALTVTDRLIWLCANDIGADELLSFADNMIYANDGAETNLWPGRFTPAEGSVRDLRPVDDDEQLVPHFLDVLSGAAGEVAGNAVCLNAAALAVASGHLADWAAAVEAANEAVRSGAARDLVDRMSARQAVTHG